MPKRTSNIKQESQLTEIINELSKPIWWVSVVIAGIAINLISSYLKGALDKKLSGASSWWRSRSDTRRRAWEIRLQRLKSSSEERRQAEASEIRNRLQSLHLLLMALFLSVLSFSTGISSLSRPLGIVCLCFSALTIFLAFLAHVRSQETARLLDQAKPPMERTDCGNLSQ